MFGRFRLGYYILFATVFTMVGLAHLLTGKPLIKFMAIPSSEAALFLVTPFLIWIAVIAFRFMRRGVERPTKALFRIIRREKVWLLRTFLLFIMVMPAGAAFSALKNHISVLVPFYADPIFVKADQLLFTTDPWRTTHWAFGERGTAFLDRDYVVFFPLGYVMLVWMCASRDKGFQLRALMTQVWGWFGLGFISATLMSSSGPVFYGEHYGSTHFDPLMERLRHIDETTPLVAIAISDWLREEMGKGSFGSGISAMPSLHVAGSWLYVLMLQDRLGTRHWMTVLGLVFAVVIWIGSVHLAWHYAVDGIVGVFLISGLWYAAGAFVRAVEDVSLPHAITSATT